MILLEIPLDSLNVTEKSAIYIIKQSGFFTKMSRHKNMSNLSAVRSHSVEVVAIYIKKQAGFHKNVYAYKQEQYLKYPNSISVEVVAM